MHHYIISFHVTIDDKDMGTGTTGIISPTSVPQLNLLKGAIIRQYRKTHPGSKVVSVQFIGEKEVSSAQYNEESKSFLVLQ